MLRALDVVALIVAALGIMTVTTNESAYALSDWGPRGVGFAPGYAKPLARRQLFCFPYAGGGASVYARWQRAMPAELDVWSVELPGRQTRASEPLQRALVPLARELALCIAPAIRSEYSLLGCSMGALLAFEVAQALRAVGLSGPRQVFALAANPPQTPRRTHWHTLPDTELLAEIGSAYVPSSRALAAAPSLQSSVLRVLRADIQMVETYAPRSSVAPLDCGITLFTGSRDHTLVAEAAHGWRAQTTAAFEHLVIEGDHFFANQAVSTVTTEVRRRLERAATHPSLP